MRMTVLFFVVFQFFDLFASTYYVAPNGSDLNPGSITQPWKTWGKAFKGRLPGDRVYFRGGVYEMTVLDGSGYSATITGTKKDSVYFLNYPGEKPILDCNTVTNILGENNVALTTYITYVKIRGLTIRNVWQFSPTDEVQVWSIGGSNSVIENCTVYNSHGRGFFPSSCNELYLINCDAYNHCDSLTDELPGNDGYGFFIQDLSSISNRVYLKGCRAWRCSDDGFACYSKAYVQFDNCWSFYNGAMEGEGHGFKLGWQEVETNTVRRVVRNCLACWNLGHGFTTNEKDLLTSYMQVYNNTSYHNLPQPFWGYNSVGFIIFKTSSSVTQEMGRDFKNNLSYADAGGSIFVGDGALYSHSNNSWELPVSVDQSDFVHTDSTGLTGPRNGNSGRLPYLQGFLELSEGSDLIDKGVDVGLPFSGLAPDLGYSEYSDQTFQEIKVTSIQISSTGDSISSQNGTLQLSVHVLPENATDKEVAWSIAGGSGKAVVDPFGKVTAISDGEIIITASTLDGSGLSANFKITIVNQSLPTGLDAQVEENLRLYKNHLSLSFSWNENIKADIAFYNLLGVLQKCFPSREKGFTVSLNDFCPGIYIILVSVRGNRKTFVISLP